VTLIRSKRSADWTRIPPLPIRSIHVNARRAFSLLAILGTLSIAGCLGGTTEPVAVSGIYELQNINGSPLPYTFSNGVVVAKEVFTINKDGTFTDATTQANGTVVVDQGAYANFGGTINFSDATAGFVYQGFVSGNTLTTKIGTFTSNYVKTGEATH
jgi:hypothetical protein